MPEAPQHSDEKHLAGARVARSTALRAGGEIVGKLATFALFAALARSLGQTSVGAFVFALAVLEVALIPVGLGSDTYLTREVAKDRAATGRLFFNIVGVKLALAGPVLALTFWAISALGYAPTVRQTVYLLSVGVVLDMLAKTLHGAFIGSERNDLLVVSLVAQRIVTAAIALGVLAAGYGVVTVAGVYSIGAALGFFLGLLLLARKMGRHAWRFAPRGWPTLARFTLPFGAQEVLVVLLFKLDAVILSLLASEAAVGRYGAAYRILESTLFVTWALNGAFAAMYVYLGRSSDPTVQSVFQRSIKLALVVLVPVAAVISALAEPICRLAFGADFTASAHPLRLLAPVAVMLCLVVLSSSLVIARRGPGAVARLTAVMVAVNVTLNLILIPAHADTGAAAAMLITELLFVAVAMRMATREVGGIAWVPTLAAPLIAGASMVAPMLVLQAVPALAFVAGLATYGLVFLLLERSISPGDLDFVRALVRRRLGPRTAA